MRFPLLVLAFVLAAHTHLALAQTASGTAPLTLAEAMRLAETSHPSVRAREAQLAAAEGSRREASALLSNNPELSTDRTRRRAGAPIGRVNEWSVALSQPFETGGQQSRRREAAAAGMDALRAEIEDVRRQARADAAARFFSRCSLRNGACSSSSARSTCSTAAHRPSRSAAPLAKTRDSTPTWRWSKPSAHATHSLWQARS